MKNASVDLLRGPILRSLLIFALPILISNIFQQLYNTADVMIVGRFLGPDALAAVGASSDIFDLVIGFALGVGNGMGIVIARYYGAQDYRKLRQSVAASCHRSGLKCPGHDSRTFRALSFAKIFRDAYFYHWAVLPVYFNDCLLCWGYFGL